MEQFKYKAKDKKGKASSGVIEAKNKEDAKAKLKAKDLRPVTLTAVKAKGPKTQPKGLMGKFVYYDDKGNMNIQLGEKLPTTKELAIFTKQFSIMIERSVPLIQTLSILANQQKLPAFKQVLTKIRLDVENGATLSTAISQHPKIFDKLYVSLVRAGEMSGKLDTILRQLVLYIERTARLKAQVKKAMIYPTLIVLVSIVVVGGLLMFFVPQIAEQYTGGGQELPGLTLLIMGLSDFLQEYLLHLIGGIIVFAVGANYWLKTEEGRKTFDGSILYAPLIGEVMQKIAVSRFCATMSTMLLSGVSILDALTICAQSAGNKKIEDFVLGVRLAISQGATFSEPLRQGNLFPSMVTSMVHVGETTGNLDETLAKITEIYEEEVENAVESMTAMIEPIMIVVIGSIVGFVLIAMYLPMFDMAGNF